MNGAQRRAARGARALALYRSTWCFDWKRAEHADSGAWNRSTLPAAGFFAALAALWLLLIGAAPAASAQEQSPAEDPPYLVVGTGPAGLTLRMGPAADQMVLGVLPEGTAVRVVQGPIGEGQWYQVELRGTGSMSGYASGAFLALERPDGGTAATTLALPQGSRVYQRAVVTGYANGSDGGAVGSRTASGTVTRWGTVAADRSLFPFGTKLRIEGFEDTVFVVEDSGSGVRGLIFDIWFPDVPTAVRFGTQRRTVTVLP